MGGTRAYVEYERSARRRAEAVRKLRGYGAVGCRDRYPVILVCWDAESEVHFQYLGLELGPLRIVTTTLDRLAKSSPLGTGCWFL